MSLVEARDVFCVYPGADGGVAALQGLTLDIDEGEVCVVLGPSGSGKTTLMRVIAGFERVGAGNQDHDLAWLLAHTTRGETWRQRLLTRHFEDLHGSRRITSEWGIRAAWIYLALRRLRFGFLTHGSDDPQAEKNLILLDLAIEGGRLALPW